MKKYFKPEIDVIFFTDEVELTTSTYSAHQLNEVMFSDAVNANETRTVSINQVGIKEISK